MRPFDQDLYLGAQHEAVRDGVLLSYAGFSVPGPGEDRKKSTAVCDWLTDAVSGVDGTVVPPEAGARACGQGALWACPVQQNMSCVGPGSCETEKEKGLVGDTGSRTSVLCNSFGNSPR